MAVEFRIKKPSTTGVFFKEIKPREAFLYDGTLFIRLDSNLCEAFELRSTRIIVFGADQRVIPVRLEFEFEILPFQNSPASGE